jgi:predicted N-formylglutamate amidohydrolase
MNALAHIAPDDLALALDSIRPTIGTRHEAELVANVMRHLIVECNRTPDDAYTAVVALVEAARE